MKSCWVCWHNFHGTSYFVYTQGAPALYRLPGTDSGGTAELGMWPLCTLVRRWRDGGSKYTRRSSLTGHVSTKTPPHTCYSGKSTEYLFCIQFKMIIFYILKTFWYRRQIFISIDILSTIFTYGATYFLCGLNKIDFNHNELLFTKTY